MKPTGRDLVHRWHGNPLIGISDLSFHCSDIHNAGIIQLQDRMVMLLTIEALQGSTLIYKAQSDDGKTFSVENKPFMVPATHGPLAMYETHGIRDPRITRLDDMFYITYLADGHHGQRIGLASTTDFKTVQYHDLITQPDVKNGVLFPEKINGRYALLKRPASGDIWISYSSDLTFWGDESVVMTPRGGFWDACRIGASAVPIEIEQGWLLIYYGAKDTSAGPLVRLGAAILDRENPSIVLARSNIPLLSPRERYERIGDIPNVVFSCGACVQDDTLMIYYGASDSCICLGTVGLAKIVDFCLSCAAPQNCLDFTEDD